MTSHLKSLFAATASSLILLGACGSSETPEIATAVIDALDEMDHAEMDMETLPIEFRVAFMSGHVEAGLALYRAGAPDQAAKHLLHPVSETHAAERAGIDALGFKSDVFESVSTMLDAGEAAASIEPLLGEAEANMVLIQAEAGGDPIAIIGFLMETALEEYAIGVTGGVISDPGEYQDAYGFSIVALKMARRIDGTADLVTELEALTETWPSGGPLAASTPASVDDVSAQIARVQSALSAL